MIYIWKKGVVCQLFVFDNQVIFNEMSNITNSWVLIAKLQIHDIKSAKRLHFFMKNDARPTILTRIVLKTKDEGYFILRPLNPKFCRFILRQLPLRRIGWAAGNLPSDSMSRPSHGCRTTDLYWCQHKYLHLRMY